ncbi:hypothetical protein RFW88_10470, partial [Acinetobacter baumannii]|nr:hypothetical protein [Acinetobacter baumannii]
MLQTLWHQFDQFKPESNNDSQVQADQPEPPSQAGRLTVVILYFKPLLYFTSLPAHPVLIVNGKQ